MSESEVAIPNEIYLDHNSTTPIHPEVVAAMHACDSAGYLNPASQHRAGRRARATLEDARDGIAELLGAKVTGHRRDQIIFTSGGTEANNLAIRGLGWPSAFARIGVSCVEHPSVLAAADWLARQGHLVEKLPVLPDGRLDVDTALTFIQQPESARLLSVMMGNNETGVLQPVAELAEPCRLANVVLHTDAVQALGKVAVHFAELGVAAMSVAAHKFQGPRGIGVLVVRHGTSLDPLLLGGSQQLGKRPGTESVSLAVGMHVALRLAVQQLAVHQRRMLELRDELQRRIEAGCSPAIVNGGTTNRLPHTLNVAFPGIDRQALVMALDLAEVYCSTGSACTSGSSEPSHVLLGMGCSADVVESSVRFSVGRTTTFAEVVSASERIIFAVNNLRRSCTIRF